MASAMEIKPIYSEIIKEMSSQCHEAVENCFASESDEHNVHLQKILDLSKSLYVIIREKTLWHEWMQLKDTLETTLKQVDEECHIAVALFDISYQLGREIMRFYAYTDHVTWKFMTKFESRGFPTRDTAEMQDAAKINIFDKHLETTHVSMKNLEERIEEFSQTIKMAMEID